MSRACPCQAREPSERCWQQLLLPRFLETAKAKVTFAERSGERTVQRFASPLAGRESTSDAASDNDTSSLRLSHMGSLQVPGVEDRNVQAGNHTPVNTVKFPR